MLMDWFWRAYDLPVWRRRFYRSGCSQRPDSK